MKTGFKEYIGSLTAVLSALILTVTCFARTSDDAKKYSIKTARAAETLICGMSGDELSSVFTRSGGYIFNERSVCGNVTIGSASAIAGITEKGVSESGFFCLPVFGDDALRGVMLVKKGVYERYSPTDLCCFMQLSDSFSPAEGTALAVVSPNKDMFTETSVYAVSQNGKAVPAAYFGNTFEMTALPQKNIGISGYKTAAKLFTVPDIGGIKSITKADIPASDTYLGERSRIALLNCADSGKKALYSAGGKLLRSAYSNKDGRFVYILEKSGEENGEVLYTLTSADGTKFRYGKADSFILRSVTADTFALSPADSPDKVLYLTDNRLSADKPSFDPHCMWKLEIR